ncbi:unnamed protein product [Mucor hiemalis]
MPPLSFYYFGYIPNHAANYVALAVFSLLFLFLIYRVFFSATSPKYLLFLPLTAAAEIAGFSIRIVCSNNPDDSLFTAMTILLLISANFILLVNYKAVGDVVRLSGVETRFFFLGPNLAKTFYKTNLIATILTTVGGSLAANDDKTVGQALTTLGIALQLCFFLAFFVCIRYVDTCPDYQYAANNKRNPKNKLMKVMYVTMALMIVRTVYRLVNDIILIVNPTDIHEWTFYVFDALMIALSFLTFCVWHIGKYIPSSSQENLDKGVFEDDGVVLQHQHPERLHSGYNNV